MTTLDSLKSALRRQVNAPALSNAHQLSDEEYSAGFDTLMQDAGWASYEDFVIPRLSQLLAPLFDSRAHLSVLEIGPGPKTVLGYLPGRMRRKIRQYTALEPNVLFATRLEEWLGPAAPALNTPQAALPLPCLEVPPNIHRIPFVANSEDASATSEAVGDAKFDVVLFCHSMYGMKPKHRLIRRALDMLSNQPQGASIVVVIHREQLHLDGLVCQQAAVFSSGLVNVADDDEVLDRFAPFVAGFSAPDTATRLEWRDVCRILGRRHHEAAAPNTHLWFQAPIVMVAFNQHAATALPELAADVPLRNGDGPGSRSVKNREARLRRPAAIASPTKVEHIQACVRWVLRRAVGLSVIGGGHSGHCLWPNVVAVDLGAFNQVSIYPAGDGLDSSPLVVAGAGCKTGDIIREATTAGLTVPLGARPSVGAGLWLQGGIGHLARLYGLACDAIMGAVVVSVASAEVLVVGRVPSQHRPSGAVTAVRRSDMETDLLWALKGAGTNLGIVVSVTFKAYPAPTYLVRNWVVLLNDQVEVRRTLANFDRLVASQLPRNCSADAYLDWDGGSLRLGVTMFETSTAGAAFTAHPSAPVDVPAALRPQTTEAGFQILDAEMYMSGMHGGHGGGKTSSFKRSSVGPNLIVLVTGLSGTGKDHCADVWVSMFTNAGFAARTVSISEATKRDYAAATGADLNRLLRDRAYKEQHRPALTAFFQNQVRQRPRLPEEHFLEVVRGATDVDVLFVTGLREEAPLAALSGLVPDRRLLEVHVQASEETRRARRGCNCEQEPDLTPLNYRPSFVFDNDAAGDEEAKAFARFHLLPFLHEDLQRLAAMVRPIPDFPRPGIEFRHVLGIPQNPGGLGLCVTLLERHFSGRWAAVDVVACCEAGGFVFASVLAARVGVPLVLIREAGKLPPPTVSATKALSHISSPGYDNKDLKESEARIEMDRDAVPKGATVLVVDDVLATGRTLCAVLQLLGKAGVVPDKVSVMIVAEFPVHRGRELLRRHGFGRVSVQSLLVFGGA